MNTILTIKDDDFGDERINVNYKKIQKMAFIYDALENGWKIKKLKDDTYEFTKEDGSKMNLSKFLQKHMKTKQILKN